MKKKKITKNKSVKSFSQRACLLPPKEFKGTRGGEEEISEFFKKNLNLVFPRLTHIWTKWRKFNENREEVDAFAIHREENWDGKGERLVFLEYKWKDRNNPVVQVTDYFRNDLKNNPHNLRQFEEDCNEYLEKNEGKGIKWVFKKKERVKFFKKRVLIAVAIPGKFKDKIIARANTEEDETILVEIQKFGDEEIEIFVLQLVQKEKSKEYRKLLGMISNVVVIHRRKQKDSERTVQARMKEIGVSNSENE